MPPIPVRSASPESADSWSLEAKLGLIAILVAIAVPFVTAVINWAVESNLYGIFKRNLSRSFSRFTTTLKAVGAWLVSHVVALGDCFPRLCGSYKNTFSSSSKGPDPEQPDVPIEVRREPLPQNLPPPPPLSPPQEGLEIQPADIQTFKRRSHSSLGHRKMYRVAYEEFRISTTDRPPTSLRRSSSDPCDFPFKSPETELERSTCDTSTPEPQPLGV
ncbi:uncharacterized protein J3D65DRAFT_641316 [Phyllosticta citribraziliensis]|uniref:Uncharacterized protein n=1 Tax=Phyllosticta citribraziliensis TaxID=989973 RepID=A0ABR1L5B4_9PEZI